MELCLRDLTQENINGFSLYVWSDLQQNGVPAGFTKRVMVGRSSRQTTSGYTRSFEAFARESIEKMTSELLSWTHWVKFDSVEVGVN